MTAHRHVFTSPDGSATRTLPQDVSGEPLRVVSSFLLKGVANGGVTDIAGLISQAELEEFAAIYVEGARWEVFDDDDLVKPFRGRGRLDAPKSNPDGTVTLHAEGPCKKNEQDSESRRLWQNRNMGEWTPDDSEPFGYDSDEQIEAKIQGQQVVLGWRRKEAFIRATGKAVLANQANKGAESVTLNVNGGGLVAGEWIHIGNETKRVKSTYSPGSTTVPIKTKLDHDHSAGSRVQWRASGNPDNWASGVIAWFPAGVEVSRVAATLIKNRNADGTTLKIYSGTGPDNVTNLLSTIQMDAAGPSTFAINAIPAGHDAIRIRLVRTKADEKTDAFRVRLANLRVNDLAGNFDVYETHKVVEDIAAFSGGGSTTAVVDSALDAMPLDTEGGSSAAILDRQALLDKRYWSIEYAQTDGVEKQWFYRDFGTQLWHVTDENVDPDWTPLPRFNVAVGPFRYAEGGVQHFTRQRAVPDPFPGESRSIGIDLVEPLPHKEIADALLRNVADLAAKERQACRATILWVEDPAAPGVSIPAGRVRAGDSLVFTLHSNKKVDVYSYEYDDDGLLTVDTTPESPGQTGIPAIDSALERRALALERGRGNAWASLHVFDLDNPLPPLDLVHGFEENEVRGGHRKYDLIADFSPVLEDINGNGTAIASYDLDFKPVDAAGDQVGPIRHRHLKPKKDNDPADDDIPTRSVVHNVPHPHKWYWQVRGRSTDIFGKKSDPTAWTARTKPAAFAPAVPETLVGDIDGPMLNAKWARPDPTELDTAGDAVLDQRVDKFRWKVLKNGVLFDNGATRSTHLSVDLGRSAGAVWVLRVWSQDQYGNLSSTYATVTATKKAPPSPASGAAGAPVVTIDADDVPAGQRRGVAKFWYTTTGGSGGTDLGSAGQYGDGDLDLFIVQGQTADDAAFTKKVRKLPLQFIEYEGLIEHEAVFKGIRKGRRLRVRYRPKDEGNHKGGWSAWST